MLSEDPLKREAHITLSVYVVKKVFKLFFKTLSLQPANHLTPKSLEPPAEACVVPDVYCLSRSEEAHYRQAIITCNTFFQIIV